MKRFKGTGGKWDAYCDDNGTHIIGTTSPYHGDLTIAEIDSSYDDSCSKADAQLMSKSKEMLQELITEVEILKSIGAQNTDRYKRKVKLIKEATTI